MRVAFLTFLVSFFFFGLAYYFYAYESPFQEEKLEEIIQANEIEPEEVDTLEFELNFIIERGLVTEYLSTNAYIGIASFFIGWILVFFFIHAVIDKLFFQEIQDPPDFKKAMRRSIILGCACFGYVAMKLQGIETQVALLIFPLGVIVDYIVGSYGQGREEVKA